MGWRFILSARSLITTTFSSKRRIDSGNWSPEDSSILQMLILIRRCNSAVDSLNHLPYPRFNAAHSQHALRSTRGISAAGRRRGEVLLMRDGGLGLRSYR